MLQRNIKAGIVCSNTFGIEEKIGNSIAQTFGMKEVLKRQNMLKKRKYIRAINKQKLISLIYLGWRKKWEIDCDNKNIWNGGSA